MLAELLRNGRARVGAPSEVAELAQRLSAVLGPAAGLPEGESPSMPSESPARNPVGTGGGHAALAGGAVLRGARSGRAIARLATWAIGGVGAGAALWLVVGGLSSAPSTPPPSPSGHETKPAAHGAAATDVPAPAAPTAPVEPPAAPTAAPAVSGELPPAKRGRASVPRAATAPRPSEAALLQKAQAALQQSPARALELTRRHQARFPQGVLAQEREVIAIEALRRLGRHDAAQARAAAFERRYSGSVHRPRLSGGADTSAPIGGALNTPD
jgi:hypothetical protein